MSTTWERFAGDEHRFAIRVAFRPDPDPSASDPDESASWGTFQLWASGKNLCAYLDQGETFESVHWYLLPLLEWLAERWDPLLHEERLPLIVRGDTAAESLRRTQAAPVSLNDEDSDAWELEWFDWWTRHALRASRDGGLFPDVVFRRWRDEVELSWGESPLAGAEGVDFLVPSGEVRLDPVEVARPLLEVLRAATVELAARSASPRLAALKLRAAAIPMRERHGSRLAWMAGLRNVGSSVWQSWRTIEDAMRGASDAARAAALDVPEQFGVIRGSCQAALLFGAVAPDVTVADVERLAKILVDQYAPGSESEELRQLVEDVPVAAGRPAWEDGYERAAVLRDDLGLSPEEPVDPAALMERLGVDVRRLSLDDDRIRGVSIASPDHRPTVVHNDRSVFGQSPEAESFTLLHEFCHLLFDRGQGQRLAVASGPWAPQDVERRANAFAAYFLMPPAGLRAYLATMDEPVNSRQGIERVASHFGVSTSAMVEHLHNLNVLDYVERAILRGWKSPMEG